MEDRFCVNCKHCLVSSMEVPALNRCGREKKHDPVSGVPTGPLCHFERSDERACGPSGRGFEPKIPEPEQKGKRPTIVGVWQKFLGLR